MHKLSLVRIADVAGGRPRPSGPPPVDRATGRALRWCTPAMGAWWRSCGAVIRAQHLAAVGGGTAGSLVREQRLPDAGLRPVRGGGGPEHSWFSRAGSDAAGPSDAGAVGAAHGG